MRRLHRHQYRQRMRRVRWSPRSVPPEPGRRWWANERPTELATSGIRHGQRRALTDLQALMEAGPGDNLDQSLLSTLPLRERLAELVDNLEPELRYVFEAVHYEGLSFRQVAVRISKSKTHTHRLYQQARQELRERL